MDLFVFRRCVLIERKSIPISSARRVWIVGHRIENKVEPLHRIFEPLVLAQRNRDQHGNMEEQLPVVTCIGTTVEIDEFCRIRASDQWCRLVPVYKQVRSILRLVGQLLTAAREKTWQAVSIQSLHPFADMWMEEGLEAKAVFR